MKEENKALIYFLIHAAIVVLVFIILTYWMMNNKQGGADIARWGLQGILYFFQLVAMILAHRGTPYLKYAFLGATFAFIMVFIIEVT